MPQRNPEAAKPTVAELETALARAQAERDEAQAQQAATAEVLGVINASSGDLAPVFEAILERAIRLCDAVQGVIWRIDGYQSRVVAAQGLPPGFIELLRESADAGTNPVLPRIVAGESLLHFVDPEQEDYYRSGNPVARAAFAAGIRSLIWVALTKDDTPIGAFAISRREVRPFSTSEIALLQSFAAQAVIAIENARLLTETRLALEQQTATAEVLGVINSSPGDLAPVFEAILEKAMSLCEAALGFMTTYDGRRFAPAAMRDVPEALAAYFAAGMDQPQPGESHWRLLEGEDLVHNLDQKDEDAYRAGSPFRRAVVDLGGTRTALVIALRKDGILRGTMTLYRKEVRAFSDQQIALLQNFAAQAVIAMENARLITETREALAQQTATAEVLGVINASPGDLAPVFEAILEKAHTFCGAPLGALVLYDGQNLRGAATRGYPSEYARLVHEGGSAAIVPAFERLLGGEPFVHEPDAAVHPLSLSTPMARAAIEIAGVRTLLLVPLRQDDKLLGYISAQRQEVRPFSDQQIALLQNFAAQAVIAMENARLLDELRQRTEEVAELNRGLEARVAAQVEELARVGRLKQFLAPQLAELVVSQGEGVLESHRREIVVVFCDLRGYTGFSETAEPEEVIEVLREYHAALGPLVGQFEGTVDQFSGDGVMVFFNDPVPCPNPAERAVDMAMAMREAAAGLTTAWRRRGHQLGFGVGIAQGYATLGQIGFAERVHYTAIGTVCNLAARLCAEAQPEQILVSQRVAAAVEDTVRLEEIGNLALKGLSQAVAVYNVAGAA